MPNNLTQRGVEILRIIQQMILEEPKRMDMCDSIRTTNDPVNPAYPACRTVGCIAGWSVIVKNMLDFNNGEILSEPEKIYECALDQDFAWYCIAEQARDILGITHAHSARLFFVSDWPREFNNSSKSYRTDCYDNIYIMEDSDDALRYGTPEYAEAVATRIQLFIDSDGEI